MISVIAFIRNSEVTGISAINYYRAVAPLSYLNQEPDFDIKILGQSEIRSLMERGLDHQLLGSDLYLTSRLFAGSAGRPEFIGAIHESGGKVIFDTDDDLTDEYRDLGRGEDFKGIIGDVDYVTVSTPYLADRMSAYANNPPVALYNHVDAGWFSEVSLQAPRLVDGLTIGMIGTASHYDDWHFPLEALHRIADEYPGVTIVSAGYTPDYLRGLSNLVELSPVPYVKYPNMMRQFDIVCCSLDPSDKFNLSKSGIKALEAMSAARMFSNKKVGGAVPVCTNTPVYRRVVNNRNSGLLVDNDQWYEALLSLVENRAFRERLAVTGHRWVGKHRDIATGYKAWGQAYKRFKGGS